MLTRCFLLCAGGWQDQIGGLFGGLKLGSSHSDVLLKAEVRSIDLIDSVRQELNNRLVLVFSGKQRLAKNILNNVLRRWARRSVDIVETVQQLVQGAHESIECLVEGDLDRLGSCMSSYWEQKKVMAGSESGAEPAFVKSLLDLLRSQCCIVGGTLCGAGGECWLTFSFIFNPVQLETNHCATSKVEDFWLCCWPKGKQWKISKS